MQSNQIAGQLDIFDWISTYSKPRKTDNKLKAGQLVYLVRKGDVREYIVQDEKPWEVSGGFAYRLKRENGGHWTTSDKDIGVTTFTSLENAHKNVEDYLSTHNVIKAETIKANSTVAYSYVRQIDNRVMTAFYSDIGNGLLYVKEFMTFHHIVKNTKKEIDKFMNQQEFEYCDLKQIELNPTFRNMYECYKTSDWLYTEPECSLCK